MIQSIVNGDEVKVLEFSARLGGGAKYQTIEKVTGFNVLRANLDSMLGEQPNVSFEPSTKFYSRCHLYVIGGQFERLDGIDILKSNGIIEECIITRASGSIVSAPKSSSDRVASLLFQADSHEELNQKIKQGINTVKVLDNHGNDILCRDMYL